MDMRKSGSAGIIIAMLGLGVYAARAGANDSGEVTISSNQAGSLDVTASPPWHVNAAYPWTVKRPGEKTPLGTVSVDAQHVRVTNLPQGTVEVRGSVCNDASCRVFRELAEVR